MCAKYVKLSDTIYQVLTVCLYISLDTILLCKHNLNSFTAKITIKVFSPIKFFVFTMFNMQGNSEVPTVK